MITKNLLAGNVLEKANTNTHTHLPPLPPPFRRGGGGVGGGDGEMNSNTHHRAPVVRPRSTPSSSFGFYFYFYFPSFIHSFFQKQILLYSCIFISFFCCFDTYISGINPIYLHFFTLMSTFHYHNIIC